MMLVAAIDVGKPANCGWATSDGDIGEGSLQPLISRIAMELDKGPVALGFEAPLYVPVRKNFPDLTKARKGEGQRAWSAAAGAQVTAIVLPLLRWTLDQIFSATKTPVSPTTNLTRLTKEPGELLLWEAFVSSSAKGESHSDDAARAVAAFMYKVNDGADSDLPTEQTTYINLASAVLLEMQAISRPLDALPIVVRV